MANARYMDLKKEAIRIASQPTRSVKQLDKAVVAYKPVSAHKIDVSALILFLYNIMLRCY